MSQRSGNWKGLSWIVAGVVWLGMVFGACRSGEARLQRGRRLFENARFQRAEQVLTPLFTGSERFREYPDRATLLYGKVLLARGELRRARNAFAWLLARSSPLRDAALYGQARTHFYLGHPDTAQTLSRRLLRWGRTRDDPLRLAQAYHVLGRTDFYEAHYDRALKHQRKSLHWARRAEDPEARADALRQLGVLYWYRGEVDSARTAFYEPALRLYRQGGDSVGVATTLSNIGLLHWQRGEWRKNLRYQLRAFAIRKRMGHQIGLADSYTFLASIPKNLGLRSSSYQITYLRKSLSLSRRIGYAWGEQVAFQRLRNQLGRSLDAWNSALLRSPDTSVFRSGEHRFLRRLRDAQLARQRKKWRRADRLFAEAHRIADSLGYYNFQRSTLITRSRVLTRLGRWDEALALLRRLKGLSAEGARPWTRTRATQLRATIALHQGDSARAADLLRPLASKLDRRYLRTLHETAPEVAFETASGVVYGRRAGVYGRLIEALKGGQPDEAFRMLERERALPFWGGRGREEESQETIDRLVRRIERLERTPTRTGEVQKLLTTLGQIRQEQLTKRQVLDRTSPAKKDLEVTSRAALQRALRRREVFVEYFVRGKQHHVFVARRDSSRFLTVSVPRDTLASTIGIYRSTLKRGRQHPNEEIWQASGRRLFARLLEPLLHKGWIQPGDHLLIAPHRRLWGVPFHALPFHSSGGETQFLIEQNIVSYVRSATDLVKHRRRPDRPLRSVLAVAPTPDALPHTKQEVGYVRAAPFARKRVLVGPAVQADTVRQVWSTYDVVHLAAHARTNERFPLYSSLDLGDQRIELYEILRHSDSDRNRLVVLSACETGRGIGAGGRPPTGASLIGFPRAFLEAGADSVIGSLWYVDDAATAKLMKNFYRQLSASDFLSSPSRYSPNSRPSLAEVLIRAQRTYLEQARRSDRPSHPFYWAGFVLIGDGR